ncbi:MAG: NADH-quinone oxidoreductase subunit I [Candidatus Omnitrophica bacterium]|nr:NADH-quinone oxidoreductase subunit I [Candidatus Omnitrophota bacterium]
MFVEIIDGTASIFKGLAVTGKNMFRRPVTIEYPFKKAAMTERFRGLVDLDPKKCIGCFQCVKICPTAALSLTTTMDPTTKSRTPKTFCFNGEICCFCGFCAEVCPVGAIGMNKRYEVAYFKRDAFSAIDLMRPEKYDHFGKTGVEKGHS